MTEAKKNKNKKNKKTPLVVLIIVCLVIVFATGLVWLYYQSQRPNFRDLEKAYNQLQIPSDWKQVSEYKVTGYKGMFCFTAGIDEACPVLIRSFHPDSKNKTHEINSYLSNINVKNIIKNSCTGINQNCKVVYKDNDIYTTIITESDNINVEKINIYVSSKDTYSL